ncbi:hypothetical protein FE257_003867 [Aspergillus nanangensis]|uniref:Uncharacterized protein n=1 Tax=Aspergillus nanangensis TaxID=2582783 RepID=A0AAD4GNA6_ASPNN|nr:hypothetical protein FE257_003867 [Aspergillus nanangensis]
MHFSPHLLSTLCMLVTGISAGLINPNHAVDIGNTACIGACVPDARSLGCKNPVFKPAKSCYMCCISDDNVDQGADQDAWADHAGDWDKNLRTGEEK